MTILAIDAARARGLASELLASAPKEAGAFCLLHSVRRSGATRLVLGKRLELRPAWSEQAAHRLTPSGQMISEAVSAAQETGAGLAFLHTHPMTGDAWLSPIDHQTSLRLATVFADLLDGPFASLVVSRDGKWAGVQGSVSNLETLAIDVVGRHLRLERGRPSARFDVELDDRQRRALGATGQAVLSELHIGVVGAGGLGSPMAEAAARMGVRRLTLIDHDLLDTPSNARRVFGVRRADVGAGGTAPAKAEIVARYLNGLDLGTEVVPRVGDVREVQTHAALLDCDVVLSGTDTHSSRAALAELSVRAQLPMIDIGVRVGVRGEGQLDSLRFERRVQIPEGPCLWCWNTLDAEQVRIETLPAEQRAKLIGEGYVTGLADGPAPSVAALTVSAAGAATSALLGMVTGGFDVAPLAVSVDALSLDSFPIGSDVPNPDCVCRRWRL
jgi:molybdopterin/thiamine biosynthesis adenylyltransferase